MLPILLTIYLTTTTLLLYVLILLAFTDKIMKNDLKHSPIYSMCLCLFMLVFSPIYIMLIITYSILCMGKNYKY